MAELSLPVYICKWCRISFSDDLYIYPIIEKESYLNLHVLKFDSFV